MIGTVGNDIIGAGPLAHRAVDAVAAAAAGRAFQSLVDGARMAETPAPTPAATKAPSTRQPVDGGAKLRDALAAFRKEATLTPAERARRDVLAAMDLTEDAIEAMPPEKRAATEEKIAAEVARRLRLKDPI